MQDVAPSEKGRQEVRGLNMYQNGPSVVVLSAAKGAEGFPVVGSGRPE